MDFCGHQDFKMASLMPLKEKKLMEVKPSAAELDIDAGFHPQWHRRSLSERA